MPNRRTTKRSADGGVPVGPSFSARVPGELLVKLTNQGQMSVTESIPSGPIRRLADAPPDRLGVAALDQILAEIGVQSINKVHGPISTATLSGVAGDAVFTASSDALPGMAAVQPSTAPLAALAQGLNATYRLRLDPAADLDQAMQRLAGAAGVAEVSPNYYRYAFATPNDPMYAQEWGLVKINCPAAWDRTTGSASVVVAVVDSGVDLDHPDLQPNLLPGYDFVDWAGMSPDAGFHFEGDFLTRDNDPQDEVGHGTHVAGTIAAISNNGVGVAGVTWSCKILPVKVMGRYVRNSDGAVFGVGTSVDIGAGVKWAADHGAHILNMSFGGDQDNFVERDAVQYAQTKGCLLVAAMGNDDISTPSYPAAYPDVVAVGAINQNEQRVSKANTGGRWGSNMGPHIDVVAPGMDIRSTVWDNAYADYQGTSMASPHVAGVAALVKSCNPSLTAAQIADILRTTARPLKDTAADPVPNDRYGYGLVDAKAAVDKACPKLKFLDQPDHVKKLLDDQQKAVRDQGFKKLVDDPKRKFTDEKPPALDRLYPQAPAAAAPFVLATPHHAAGYEETPEAAGADLQAWLADVAAVLSALEEMEQKGGLTATGKQYLESLRQAYRSAGGNA
jgi:subtilisin family serine protease